MQKSPRQRELTAFADSVRWLSADRARASYEYSLRYNSDQHYGLNPAAIEKIERHKIASASVAVHWVRDRVPDCGSVQVVFGAGDVFVAPTAFFLENWPHLFTPARDDVLILSSDDDWVLFYCHEDELEFGLRTT